MNLRPLREGMSLYLLRKGNTEKENIEISIDMIPQKVSYSYIPSFSAQHILGRASPVFLYTGGSNITYEFSVTLHEDALSEVQKLKYKTLEGFIDAIKMLSFPALKDADNISKGYEASLRNVYFQLGDISGLGIINTSVEWKKPLRDGRYIMADVSFTITVVKIFPKVEKYYKTVKTEAGPSIDTLTLIYDVEYTNTAAQNILGDAYTFGYNTGAIHKELYNNSIETFNYALGRMGSLYRAFFSEDPEGKLTEGLKIFSSKKTLDTENVNVELATYNAALDKLTDKFIKKGMDNYYKVNKKITKEEQTLIEEYIKNLVQTLKNAAEAINKYGASD
jgi:hypothetical protein